MYIVVIRVENFFQLKLYAYTENERGRQSVTDTYFVLNEQAFTSSCGSLDFNNCTIFPTSLPTIVYSTFLAVAGVAYIIILLSIRILFQRWKRWKLKKIIKSWNRQEISLTIGFLVVVFMFSVAEFFSELISVVQWENGGCSYTNHLKTVLISVTPVFLIVIAVVISVFKSCQTKGNVFSYYFLRISLFFCPAAFLFFWLSSSYLVIFVLGFAYPLNILALIALHIAIVFVFTVAFAVLIAQVLADYEKSKIAVIRKGKLIHNKLLSYSCFTLLLYIALGLLLPILAILVYVCVIISFGLTVVQGLVTSEGAQAAVIFLPSLIMFLTGWLVKKKFFGDNSKLCIPIYTSMIKC